MNGERIDDLGRGGFKLIQNRGQFRFGTDSVLLAAFCCIKRNDTVLDLGAGNGILPILLCSRHTDKNPRIRGLEIQAEAAELARRNIALNNLNEFVEIDSGDIMNVRNIYNHGSFDVVVTNPPYQKAGQNHARAEILCTLDGVINAAAWALKYGGRVYMVHKPERLTDIICSCRANGVEVKRVRFVTAREGEKPSLALIYAKKGAAGGVVIESNLVLHDKDGSYANEARKIYYE